jgi:hypothetical protein
MGLAHGSSIGFPVQPIRPPRYINSSIGAAFSRSKTKADTLMKTEEGVDSMPERETIERAQEDEREGKSPSTQAGEFVREEMHHIREGKHGAASTKQAIAIGLSKARRAGVKLPAKGSAATRKKADQDATASHARSKPSAKRSRATSSALKREPRTAASPRSLARQAKSSAASRGKRARSAAAQKAANTRRRAA